MHTSVISVSLVLAQKAVEQLEMKVAAYRNLYSYCLLLL